MSSLTGSGFIEPRGLSVPLLVRMDGPRGATSGCRVTHVHLPSVRNRTSFFQKTISTPEVARGNAGWQMVFLDGVSTQQVEGAEGLGAPLPGAGRTSGPWS